MADDLKKYMTNKNIGMVGSALLAAPMAYMLTPSKDKRLRFLMVLLAGAGAGWAGHKYGNEIMGFFGAKPDPAAPVPAPDKPASTTPGQTPAQTPAQAPVQTAFTPDANKGQAMNRETYNEMRRRLATSAYDVKERAKQFRNMAENAGDTDVVGSIDRINNATDLTPEKKIDFLGKYMDSEFKKTPAAAVK